MYLLEKTVEYAVEDFYRNSLFKQRVFEPIKICNITVDQFQQLFEEEEGKYTSVLMYKDGAIYIVDSSSYMHDYVSLSIPFSFLSNPFIRKYFFPSGSGGNAVMFIIRYIVNWEAIRPEYVEGTQQMLNDGAPPPTIAVRVGWSQSRSSLLNKCIMYYIAFRTE